MTETELAYIAGFFDGEGCIGIYANGKKTAYFLSVQVTQNRSPESDALMQSLVDEWGGRLKLRVKQSVASHFYLTGHRAAKMLSDLLPYLRLKREQAEMAIAWQAPKEKWNQRDVRGRLTSRPIEEIERDRAVSDMLKQMKRVAA